MRGRLLATIAAVGTALGLAAAPVWRQDALAQQVTINLSDAPEAGAGDPGTLTVRLHGKLLLFLGGTGWDGANTGYNYDYGTGYAASGPFAVAPGGAIVPAGTPGALRGSVPLRQSLATVRPADIARLYPGLDGVTSSGLRYGVSLDLAVNNIGQTYSGLYQGPLAAGRVSNQPQLRQAYGYLGLGDYGTVRAGAADGPSSLFMTGNFERFNSGGWNGAIPYSLPRQWNTIWPFADVEAEYSTPKLIYLSPRFGDVDAAVSFEPSGNGLLGAEQSGCANAALRRGGLAVGGTTQAGAGCDVSAAGLAPGPVSVLAGRRDTFDAALRYRGEVGEVGVAAYVAYTGSAAVHTSTSPGAVAQSYQGLQVGAAGAQAYYAGATFGGMVMGGSIDNTTASYGLQPAGTAPQTAYLVGGSYAIERFTVGASYFSTWQAGYQTASTAATVGTYNAQGVAAGGTFAWRPGVSLYLEYLWGQIKQNGYDLDLLSTGTAHNKLDLQYIGLGAGVSW